MIEFEEVTRRYGPTLAVDGLSLTVGRGELFALLGPNGAGKTTTIRMLVGLLRPDAGTIRVCGCDGAVGARQSNRFLGYVPEEPFLYDKLSGREFLEFARRDARIGPGRPVEPASIEKPSDSSWPVFWTI